MLAIFSLNGSWNLPEARPDLTSTRCPPSIVQRFGRLPFKAASGEEARMSALLLIFSMREGTDEASWGSSSLPSSSLKSFSKQLTSLHVDTEPAGRTQYWSDSDAPKPEAMREAADGKPMARSRSIASGRKSGMPLFLNQIESLSRVMLPYGSTDMSGAWPASKTWVLPVTAWRSWSQVSSATSWSRHMRVSRDSSGGLPSINWLRSFRLPATTCCHSTAWSLATCKPAQKAASAPST